MLLEQRFQPERPGIPLKPARELPPSLLLILLPLRNPNLHLQRALFCEQHPCFGQLTTIGGCIDTASSRHSSFLAGSDGRALSILG